MPKSKPVVWIIVNCPNKKLATTIGDTLLHERLIACFDIIPERLTAYFWPARSGKIERGKGSMLIGVTFPRYYTTIARRVRALHTDKIPFIGTIAIDRVNSDYYTWLQRELK